MAQHARPHVSVHHRNRGHSAVTGAALRLGLRLYDEGQGVWRDFAGHALRGEVICGVTVAPHGAPGWATDPALLWNRVESSEHRRDAQVARDVGFTLPRDMPEGQAAEVAERMARLVSERLSVPVSAGLRRQPAEDVTGVANTGTERLHVHLYLPTRPIECGTGMAADGTESLGFGPKHSLLAVRQASAEVGRALEGIWAPYVQQGSRLPQLVGPDRGGEEQLGRGAATSTPVEPSPARPASDLAPTRHGNGTLVTHLRSEPVTHHDATDATRHRMRAQAQVVYEAIALAAKPSELQLARERGSRPDAALADRFAHALPIGAAVSLETGTKLICQARKLQRTLSVLGGVGQRALDAHRSHASAYASLHENRYDVDEALRRLDACNERIQAWRANHRLRLRLVRLVKGHRGLPKDLVCLMRASEAEAKRLSLHQGGRRARQEAAEEAGVAMARLQDWQARLVLRVHTIVQTVIALEAGAMPLLLSLLSGSERECVAAHMPPPSAPEAGPTDDVPDGPVGRGSMRTRLRPRAA